MLSLLTISRFGERICKHYICFIDSAVTFSIVQAARRLSAIYILAILFHEDFPSSLVIGSILCTIGFTCKILSTILMTTDKKVTSSSGTTMSATNMKEEEDGIELVTTT